MATAQALLAALAQGRPIGAEAPETEEEDESNLVVCCGGLSLRDIELPTIWVNPVAEYDWDDYYLEANLPKQRVLPGQAWLIHDRAMCSAEPKELDLVSSPLDS